MSETVECKNAGSNKVRERQLRVCAAAFRNGERIRLPSDGMSSALHKIIAKYPLLTAEEESELMMREPGRWRELLVLHNAGFVINKAKKWSGLYRFMDVDDMIQYGLMGLWKAAQRFEPHRGLRFSTYAGYWAENEMKDQARRIWIEIDIRSDSLNRKIELKEEDGGEVLDFIQPSMAAEFKETALSEWLEFRDEVELVNEIINRMKFKDERQKDCYTRVRQGELETDVAKSYGVSRQRISQVITKVDGLVRRKIRQLDRRPRIQTTNWDRFAASSEARRNLSVGQTAYDYNLALLIAYERYKLGIRKSAPLMVREERGPELKSEGFTVKSLVVKGEKFVFKGRKWVPAPKEEDYGYEEEA